MDIKSFIQQIGLEDKLPFVINFEIQPIAPTGATKQIGNLTFPLLSDLTMREVYIFDAIDEYSGYNLHLATLERIILEMANTMSQAIGEKDLAKCVGYVYETPSEVQEHKNFPKYLELTAPKRAELNKVGELLSNPMVVWAKVTFFILSRVDANWTFEQTANLSKADIEAISDLIASEKAKESPEVAGFAEPEAKAEVPSGK